MGEYFDSAIEEFTNAIHKTLAMFSDENIDKTVARLREAYELYQVISKGIASFGSSLSGLWSRDIGQRSLSEEEQRLQQIFQNNPKARSLIETFAKTTRNHGLSQDIREDRL